MALFDVQLTELEGGHCAALSGEIDLSTVAELESRLDAAINGGSELLVLDLRDVSFLDSSGLRLILRLDARQRKDGARLVLVQGPRRVAKVFELTGADERLEIVAELSEAQ